MKPAKKTKIMASAVKIEKLQKTDVPTEFQKEEGCVSFQKVRIQYEFYGKEMVEIFDTKILPNGSQFIIDGNGFIKSGMQI